MCSASCINELKYLRKGHLPHQPCIKKKKSSFKVLSETFLFGKSAKLIFTSYWVGQNGRSGFPYLTENTNDGFGQPNTWHDNYSHNSGELAMSKPSLSL